MESERLKLAAGLWLAGMAIVLAAVLFGVGHLPAAAALAAPAWSAI